VHQDSFLKLDGYCIRITLRQIAHFELQIKAILTVKTKRIFQADSSGLARLRKKARARRAEIHFLEEMEETVRIMRQMIVHRNKFLYRIVTAGVCRSH
jgi:SpoU rRNA methylase family enzyme